MTFSVGLQERGGADATITATISTLVAAVTFTLTANNNFDGDEKRRRRLWMWEAVKATGASFNQINNNDFCRKLPVEVNDRACLFVCVCV